VTWEQAPKIDDYPCWIACRCTHADREFPRWCSEYGGWTLAGRIWRYVVHTWIGEERKDLEERWAVVHWFKAMEADQEGVKAGDLRWDPDHERHFLTHYFADETLAAAFRLRFGGHP
jgi:hypothetical protein